ncbi:MAG TPA: 6-hydroxycyclohex-1-ene-1-carbonyl-CoA dehydrogenase [Gemmatimonadales bacterium]|nr:6-hydroxycyclohex-1-ene-1-carbonyl-CoA dehydrogenase [Gemmatimonadales bacterium]
MRALQLTAPGTLELREVPRPIPLRDQVLVRVAGCGVCHTDIGFWKDGVGTKQAPPVTLGHEVSGTVVGAGDEFKHVVGAEVIVPAVIPCGTCELCARGRGNVCRSQVMPGNDIDGGFADLVAVPGRGLCVVKDRGPYGLAELSVVADAVTTPYQAVVRSGLAAGELAIVVGTGGVGGYAVQIAASLGAHVVALDVDDARLAALAAHGAGLALNTAATDFKELRRRVRAFAAERGCGESGWKIFECSGHPGGQETAWGLLTHAATLMVVGFTLSKVSLRLSNAMAFDATVQGTWGCRPELYPAALELVTSGRVALGPFVEPHPLADGVAVLASVAERKLARRAILVPGDA